MPRNRPCQPRFGGSAVRECRPVIARPSVVDRRITPGERLRSYSSAAEPSAPSSARDSSAIHSSTPGASSTSSSCSSPASLTVPPHVEPAGDLSDLRVRITRRAASAIAGLMAAARAPRTVSACCREHPRGDLCGRSVGGASQARSPRSRPIWRDALPDRPEVPAKMSATEPAVRDTSVSSRSCERFLLVCLHGLLAVVGPHPRNRLACRRPGQHGKAGECRPGSTMAPQAPHLH